ncbi:MAG: hypothetical protein KA340_01405 [Saprospiraceae bacterium]|nr:hypothetical protein [Saprospiraceae bacterium]
MHRITRILLAFTIALTLGGKPLIDLWVYDTLIVLYEQSEEEEVSHKDSIKELKFVKKYIPLVESTPEVEQLHHNFITISLSHLFKGASVLQPPELA